MPSNSLGSRQVIEIRPVNEVHVRIICEPSVAQELSDRFSFEIPGARFHPMVKARRWDGIMRLFSTRTHLLYKGLVSYVQEYAKREGLGCKVGPEILRSTRFEEEDALEFIHRLGLPERFEIRDYQIQAFKTCVQHQRGLAILPTGAGKSMVIYWLCRYFFSYHAMSEGLGGGAHARWKALIIVDSLNLLHQMFSDFKEYGFDSDKNIHKIYSGQEKDSNQQIYITTWQSAAKQPKDWFNKFGLVIGDEAHQFEAKSFRKIMESLTSCAHRFGLTGTLTGSKINQMVLEGLFGRYYKPVSTRELIDKGHLSKVNIRCIVLGYPKTDIREMVSAKYQDEIDFIYNHKGRNNFICNLVLSLRGNTLLLFQRVSQHGIPLFTQIKHETDLPVYYVSGMIEGDEREQIRKIVNSHRESITVASVGTFSKGINIPNINNIVIASPTKSQVRVLQSIGRGLRKTETKKTCQVFDIADDLSRGKRKNYTLKHFAERLAMYVKEEFPYKTYFVDLS